MYRRVLLFTTVFFALMISPLTSFSMEDSAELKPSRIIRSPSPLRQPSLHMSPSLEDFMQALIKKYDEKGDEGVKTILKDYLITNRTINVILHGAISKNKFSFVRYLALNYPKKITINVPDENQECALYKAAKIGSAGIIQQLLALGADVNIPNAQGDTALHAGAQLGHTEVLASLFRAPTVTLDAQNVQQQTPLIIAVEYGHWGAFQLLLEHGADVNIQSKNNKTLLHSAVEGGNLAIVLNLLKTYKLNPEIPDDLGRTPYDIAATYNDTTMMNNLMPKKHVSLLEQSL